MTWLLFMLEECDIQRMQIAIKTNQNLKFMPLLGWRKLSKNFCW